MKSTVSAFGEILWDIYEGRGGAMQRLPGGAPLNVCVTAAKLGARAKLVGAVGEDRFGDELTTVLDREKVDTSAIARRKERTGITFIKRQADGEPSFLFYRQQTADVSFAVRDLHPKAAEATFALVGTSTLMSPSLEKATYAYLKQATQYKATFVVDLNVRAHLWSSKKAMQSSIAALVKHADIIKASVDDLEHLGCPDPLSFAPSALWFVTHGSEPATVLRKGEIATIPTERLRVVDATGAGDAFLAATLTALGKRTRTLEACAHAVEIGHAVAGRVVTAQGSTTGLSRAALARIRAEL